MAYCEADHTRRIEIAAHCSQRPEWVAPLKSNIERFLTGTDPRGLQGVHESYQLAVGMEQLDNPASILEGRDL